MVTPMSALSSLLRAGALTATAGAYVVLTGCNSNGGFLFPGAPIPDIYVLTAENGDVLVPVDIASVDDVRANTIYAEVGPSGIPGRGGITFELTGTGNDICVWMDPEIAYWNQAVNQRPSALDRKWSYPDNVFDDGDIDMYAGQSVYYTGSPGEVIGDFVVQYEDSLGQVVPVSLASCPSTVGAFEDPAAAGRGFPEYCTLSATEPGVGYTILLKTWSTPLDDDRLAFGLLIANGNCDDLRDTIFDGAGTVEQDECLIQGEALRPEGEDFGPFYGFEAAADRRWERSIDFENQFCVPPSDDRASYMSTFCNAELDRLEEEGLTCQRQAVDDPAARCYCGDIQDSPKAGAF
jgi:hypothetical protein